MKANELRIGNWIKYTTDKELTRRYHNTLAQVDIDILMDVEHFIKSKWFAPLPLTPEILEKCGFIKTSYSNHKSNPYISQEIRDLDFFDHRFNNMVLSGVGRPIEFYEVEYCPLDIEERTYIAKLNHLHQLQNLYYALTNQELEIKL
jgi:hypothetical protein